MSKISILLVVLSISPACSREELNRKWEKETQCKVVKLTTPRAFDMTTPKIDNQVCMIECTFDKGNHSGVASAVPVDCKWYGEPVTRKD